MEAAALQLVGHSQQVSLSLAPVLTVRRWEWTLISGCSGGVWAAGRGALSAAHNLGLHAHQVTGRPVGCLSTG